MKFNYTIIGCGLFGAVFANLARTKGYRVQIIEARDHIGGNIYTEKVEGIHVHRYGPHIFHTNNKEIWNFVNRFVKFNDYRHKAFSSVQNELYTLPINLTTMHKVWPSVTKPAHARLKIEEETAPYQYLEGKNAEEYALKTIGPTLYGLLIKDYTMKQWGRHPSHLPSSILGRLPIRYDHNDCYFKNAKYQGIPQHGYTQLIERLIFGVPVQLGVKFDIDDYEPDMGTIVWTGPIDALCQYRHGKLDYRSLKFMNSIEAGEYQGVAIVNYPSIELGYTRIVEHKYFDPGNTSPLTYVTYEFPSKEGDPYYPIRDAANLEKLQKYMEEVKDLPVIVGGRLGTYQYYDMDQVIAQAITRFKREMERPVSA